MRNKLEVTVSVRTEPANTKLVIGVWHSFFSEWNAKPVMAETLRQRWPQMNVVQRHRC